MRQEPFAMTIPVRTSATADPFGTTSVRARVLEAWRAMPARFREDANAEEDFALGAYRDRVIVELLQNAGDAARKAGVAGRVHIALADDALSVSNTGSPLDAPGALSLSTLRASAKRGEEGAVGRFGVGFASVLALTDEPEVRSAHGSVRFSRTATRELVRSTPELLDELSLRGDHVPVLRLPFTCDAKPMSEFQTTIWLPLRDAAAQDAARWLLRQIDDLLLLALPGITSLSVDDGQAQKQFVVERNQDAATIYADGHPRHWLVRQRTAAAAAAGPVTQSRAGPWQSGKRARRVSIGSWHPR